jgi:hypothetical protein
MLIIIAILSFIAIVIGAIFAMAALEDQDGPVFLVGLLIALVGTLGVWYSFSGQDEIRYQKKEAVCSQIDGSQWISDANICIKDGKVVEL